MFLIFLIHTNWNVEKSYQILNVCVQQSDTELEHQIFFKFCVSLCLALTSCQITQAQRKQNQIILINEMSLYLETCFALLNLKGQRYKGYLLQLQ